MGRLKPKKERSSIKNSIQRVGKDSQFQCFIQEKGRIFVERLNNCGLYQAKKR